jgi:hypothetical protein
MLQGYGIVVGLSGTGDSQQTPFTATLIENALKKWGTAIDATRFRPKNVAAVSITAELPPFAAPGNTIDVTVSSIGDAKSLEGGTLLIAPLYGPSNFETVITVAQGAVSIGGFNASAGGNTVRKNHTNVGRIPGGGIVERGVDTQTVFDGNTLYFELYIPDLTTSQRVAGKTGTAQKIEPDGSYSTKRYQAWFVGAAPADQPRVVVAAMIDEPRGYIHTGGATAAPVFAQVTAAALARDGILTEPSLPLPEWARIDWIPPWKTEKKPAAPKPQPKVGAAPPRRVAKAEAPARPTAARTKDATQATPQAPRSGARSEATRGLASREPSEVPGVASEVTRLGDRILLPDFRGQSPEQVRGQLAAAGIRLQASGSGRAVAQDPAPGTIVRGGSIRVRFAAGGGAR